MAGHKILLIDDHATVRSLIETMLALRGYQVLHALDGKIGLELARQERPDLILLDVMMPGLDGFEVCRRLKADQATATIPVIFLSAQDDHRSAAQGIDCGGIAYLRKPFRAQEILGLLQAHLAGVTPA